MENNLLFLKTMCEGRVIIEQKKEISGAYAIVANPTHGMESLGVEKILIVSVTLILERGEGGDD